jgi:hypothetical protein
MNVLTHCKSTSRQFSGPSHNFPSRSNRSVNCSLRDLDRDVTAEPGVSGAIHLSHSASAHGRENFIRPSLWPTNNGIHCSS